MGLTWNRGQLMIQFREVFFFFFLSPRLGTCCSVSGRFQQTPLAVAQCSAFPVRLSVLTLEACMLGLAVAHFSRALRVYMRARLYHPLMHKIMQHAARAIWLRL